VRSKAQDLFKACHVLAEPSQNEFALFAARHFGTEKLEDEWICRLSNPPDRCFGSLNFQATQASAIDKRLWILSDGSTTKLCNSVAGYRTIEKADEKEAQREASSFIVTSEN
jgi:hypothetical protein